MSTSDSHKKSIPDKVPLPNIIEPETRVKTRLSSEKTISNRNYRSIFRAYRKNAAVATPVASKLNPYPPTTRAPHASER